MNAAKKDVLLMKSVQSILSLALQLCSDINKIQCYVSPSVASDLLPIDIVGSLQPMIMHVAPRIYNQI